jgi:large subunit ribosomal protein L10
MAVLADYRGLNVSQISELRRQLRPADVELRVVKNTLARLAARAADREMLLPALEGPTAIAFSYGEPATLAKTLMDTIRTQRLTMTVKNGLLGDRLLAPADVTRLAELPSRDVLIAQVVGSVQAPIAGLVNVLAGTLGSLLGVLEARRAQLEEGGASV